VSRLATRLMSSAWVIRFSYLTGLLYKRFENFILLTRLNRPIGIFLLLWPTLWALWLASDGNVDLRTLLVFVAGVVLMRSAGCAINDFLDRNFDKRVKRTADRPLAAGRMKPVTAVVIFVSLAALAFALVVLFLNRLSMYLSIGAVLLAMTYPLMKRITHLPQVVLGMAFAMSVPMAYATYDELKIETLILYVGVVLWTVVYDTMYALVDKEDDVKVGIKSTAILFGDMYRLIIGLLQVGVFLALLLVGDKHQMTYPFYAGLGTAALLAGYQLFLVYDREPARCFRAFLNNGWYGAFIFLGIVFHYVLLEKSYSVHFYVLLGYVGSVLLVYFMAILRHASRRFWVFVALLTGPLALFLVPFARRHL